MPYKQMSIYKKQKSYRKFIFIVQYPMESPAALLCEGLAGHAKLFIFCCYGEKYLLSRIASAVSSPRVVQRHQPENCSAVSLTLLWAWR